jgi:hypothetical protein
MNSIARDLNYQEDGDGRESERSSRHERISQNLNIGILDILSEMYGVSDKDIYHFEKTRVIPSMKKIFGEATEGERVIATGIDRMPAKNLEAIKKLVSDDKGISLGLHELANHLMGLYMLTQDEKYLFKIRDKNWM